MTGSPLDGARPGRLAGLPRRIWLTYRYHGVAGLARHAFLFPLRFTRLAPRLGLGREARRVQAEARRWYATHGRPVTIVIPSFADAELVSALVDGIRRTTPAENVSLIVADDATGPEHVTALRAIDGITVLAGDVNAGFAANVNRGLRAADPDPDVVLLNSDVMPIAGWLEALQYALEQRQQAGIAGAKLLYPDGRIQYAGTIRNATAPEWFDHRYRGKPADWGPADISGPTLAATGACMYIRREVLDTIGLFDEAYGMGYEDVDYCLRAWQAGFEVLYAPSAQLHHYESLVRGTEQGERELRSQQVFWERWSDFFATRPVRTVDGRTRVIYITEGTIVGGGHRVVFEHLNRLADRGHAVELWTLDPPPDWFPLRCPVRTFANYDALQADLAPLEAIKVATWWRTAPAVWRASVVRGTAAYFVQDIETSYYPDSPERRHEVLDTYRPEFAYLTTSSWNAERLCELGLEPTIVSPGVDETCFHPLGSVTREPRTLVALGRTDPLKNFPLTLRAWQRLPAPRPTLRVFGSHPELASQPGIDHVQRPTDVEVNELLNSATVFVQTSSHEGFCLPLLEAMASGAPVVCTDADGNRDFCTDGENCLMPEANPVAVAGAITQLLENAQLRDRLTTAGRSTAAHYTWPTRIDALEAWMQSLGGGTQGEPPPS